MDRRKFLATAAGTLAAGALPMQAAFAAGKKTSARASDLIVTHAGTVDQMHVVRKSAYECVSAAQACLQHCEEALLAGNGEMFAECSIAVRQMIPLCEAVGTLAAYKAKRVREVLDACINACKTCEDACRPHESHSDICKECLQRCEACREACVKLKKLI